LATQPRHLRVDLTSAPGQRQPYRVCSLHSPSNGGNQHGSCAILDYCFSLSKFITYESGVPGLAAAAALGAWWMCRASVLTLTLTSELCLINPPMHEDT
jgi:hypothetical protein